MSDELLTSEELDRVIVIRALVRWQIDYALIKTERPLMVMAASYKYSMQTLKVIFDNVGLMALNGLPDTPNRFDGAADDAWLLFGEGLLTKQSALEWLKYSVSHTTCADTRALNESRIRVLEGTK